MSDDLPDGWAEVPFLSIVDYSGGAQPPKSAFRYEPTEGYVRLLQIRDFGDKPFPSYVPVSPRLKLAKATDLLVARYGGSAASDSLGRICTGLDGAYNVALAKLAFDEHAIDRGFLRAWFQGPWFKNHVGRNSRSCQTGFNRDDLEDMTIRVAPVAEQRRIVAKVEALLARVNAARERVERVPHILRQFRQSVLAAACSGELTKHLREGSDAVGWQGSGTFVESHRAALKERRVDEKLRDDLPLPDLPDSWRWVKLGYLFAPDEAFCYGVVQPGKDSPEGVPLIRAGDLLSLPESLNDVRRIPRSVDAKYRRSSLRGGEILVGVVGNIGHVALAPAAAKGFNIARAVAKLPVREASAEYVLMWLRSSLARGWMVGDSREVARPTLNLEQLETLPVPLPPRAEQDVIVRTAAPLITMANLTEARAMTALALGSRLPQAILQRAFAGELVPTEAEFARQDGREYESGEALLERSLDVRGQLKSGAKSSASTRKKPEAA